MSRYAVAYANLFDNDIMLELVEAESIREAVQKHSQIGILEDIPHEIQAIKDWFFNQEWLVDCILIEDQDKPSAPASA